METLTETAAAEHSIPRTLKILCSGAATLLVAMPAAAAGTAAARSRPGRSSQRSPDLVQAALSQAGRDLVFTVRTAAPLPLAKLDRLPNGGTGSPYFCLALSRSGRSGERRICLGGPDRPRRRLGLELVNGVGAIADRSTLPARLKRPRPDQLSVALRPETAGLAPHRYRWRVLENRRGCSQAECEESLPSEGTRLFRLRPVRPVGCTGGSATTVFEGPSDRRVVALTFDDGPSEYTEGFLDVLRREQIHGTFFEVGQEMSGRRQTMRRILREGSEIGDHTMHHVEYPGYSEIAGAAGRIAAYTHFEPCLFRPPGGAVNSSVVATAGALRMKTVLWNVDPVDWSTPGSDAVYSRIVEATRPGSIVLMHDGGGNRSGTLAALPRVIETLRGRGYRFATVSQLLGRRLIYRPYG